MSEPIQRRKIHQEVADRLLQRIRSGELATGALLPSERELMAHYGVGRPAVREALQSLARSGIVEISHGERARVVVPTAQLLIEQLASGAQHLLHMQPDTLGHLLEARVFLEAGLCRIAAERASGDDVGRLRACLQRQTDARPGQTGTGTGKGEGEADQTDWAQGDGPGGGQSVDSGPDATASPGGGAGAARAATTARQTMDPALLDPFLRCDMLFHREIAAVSGNPIFPAIVEALFNWAQAHHRALVRAPGAEALTLSEHSRIIDAIAQRDPDAAAEAMRLHLTRANAQYQTQAPGKR